MGFEKIEREKRNEQKEKERQAEILSSLLAAASISEEELKRTREEISEWIEAKKEK
jgi:uncharacterized membrane protein